MISFSLLFSILLACSKQTDFAGPVTGASVSAINKTVLLQLVNAARKKGCNCGDTYYPPAPPVAWNEKLEKAAQNHSNDMQENHYFSHTNLQGQSAGMRLKNVGYQYWGYGENIANGYGSEEAVIRGWLTSPGHCSNIMSKAYDEMGVGKAGSYWTQVMAAGK